jgi:hypothetical protein
MPKVDDTIKSGTMDEEAEGGDWRLEVKDDKKNRVGGSNAQLVRTVGWVGEKNIIESMR